jgi:tetratricopeptide (TPR) repeat protein
MFREYLVGFPVNQLPPGGRGLAYRKVFMSFHRMILGVFLVMVSSVTSVADSGELSDSVYNDVLRLSKEGDAQAEIGSYESAVQKYVEALALLPEPKTDWEACTWLLTSIGDAHFSAKNYEQARIALTEAMRCPDAVGNPFIHLRLGQAQFELGNMTRANDELARAYMAAGKEIFEDEDPKYYTHLQTVLKRPAGGEW